MVSGGRSSTTDDGVCKDGFVGMLDKDIENTEVLPVMHMDFGEQVFDIEMDGDVVYRDDLTGQVLDPRLVGEASGSRRRSTKPVGGL